MLILIGKYNSSNLTSDSALENFAIAVSILDDYGMDKLELTNNTHSYLVEYFETIGQSDRATFHSLKLAIENDPESLIKPPLLYGHFPTFSADENVKSKSFSIKLEYNIDENGQTKNIRVLESSDKKMEQKVIDAVSTWRYAPSYFENKFFEVKDMPFSFSFTRIN